MRSVLLLGDSHLAKLSKPSVTTLENLIGDVVVHNAAMGGADSADVARRAPLLAQISWDGVVISVGTNDLAPWKRVPVPDFTDNLRLVLTVFARARVVVLGPPPVDETLQVGSCRRTADLVHVYAAAARQIADDLHATFLDIAALLNAGVERGSPTHVTDGVHLSPASYDQLLPALAHALQATTTTTR